MKKGKRKPRCYLCNQAITFAETEKTESGKYIPLNLDGTRHNCPKSPYNLRRSKKEVVDAN